MDWLWTNFGLLTPSNQHNIKWQATDKDNVFTYLGIKFEIVNDLSNTANTFLDAMDWSVRIKTDNDMQIHHKVNIIYHTVITNKCGISNETLQNIKLVRLQQLVEQSNLKVPLNVDFYKLGWERLSKIVKHDDLDKIERIWSNLDLSDNIDELLIIDHNEVEVDAYEVWKKLIYSEFGDKTMDKHFTLLASGILTTHNVKYLDNDDLQKFADAYNVRGDPENAMNYTRPDFSEAWVKRIIALQNSVR